MEKRKPNYELAQIQSAFSSKRNLSATYTAICSARELGLSIEDIIEVIQSIKREHFIKSMTSHYNHKVWQDVYNTPWQGMLLYIKFVGEKMTGFRLVSFKEK